MKFKFDKETLIKQRFWLLLALVIPCTLIAILTLVTSVAAEIAKKQKEVADKVKAAQGSPNASEMKNQTMIEEIKKKADELKDQEGDVWKIAYDAEASIFRWPTKMEQEFEMTNGLHAWDIKVDRSKKDLSEMPEDKPEQNLIHGKVVKNTRDFLILTDRKNKEYKFYHTRKIKVSIDGKDTFAPNIQDGRRGSPDLVAVTYEKGLFFGDPLTDAQQNLFNKEYRTQVHGILQQINPMTDRGEGVVQMRGWGYSDKDDPPTGRFFHCKTDDWKLGQDFSEEAWIAQEDLWIQDEIFRLIRLANDYVSEFEPNYMRTRKTKEGEVKGKNFTFKNPYWELTLNWQGGNTLKATLKNKLNRRQKLEFDVLVRMSLNKNLPPEKLRITGEPLNPKGMANDTRTVELKLDNGPTRTGIYGVQQVLTWETAAIRRVDNICFAKLGGAESESNRTFPEPLKPYREKKDEGGGGSAEPKGGGDKSGAAAVPIAGGPGGQGNQQLAGALPNGFVRDRYLEVTPQLRRLPVAVCVIVEQEHVDRVQTAFNNSRFRFLTTQVLLNRSPGSVRPQLVAEVDGEGPKGGAIPNGGAQPSSGGGINEDLETNVELVIYGIMTIYERFPVRVYNPAEAK